MCFVCDATAQIGMLVFVGQAAASQLIVLRQGCPLSQCPHPRLRDSFPKPPPLSQRSSKADAQQEFLV
eukprot:8041228-Heterocapsa_arctica.AAC.1